MEPIPPCTSPMAPPYTTTLTYTKLSPPPSNVVTLNVGGTIFQTTRKTLSKAGPNSILSSPPPFIDRDPHLFSQLLSYLRTGVSPSSISVDLLHESRFYHITLPLFSSPQPLQPFSLQRSTLLPLHGRDPPASIHHTSPDGSLHVPHGSKITSFHPSLRRSTLLTPLPTVDHVIPLPSSSSSSAADSTHLLAAGASDFPGIHLFDQNDVGTGGLKSVLHWSPYPQPNIAPKSTVMALEASTSTLFSSFDSCRRNANVIATYDLQTLRLSGEIARQEVSSAEAGDSIPATKLRWVPRRGLLMAAGSHGGPFGLVGNVRLWDVRSGKVAWEVREEEDCFADVAASDELDALFKVCAGSGDVCMVDLRVMGDWVKVGKWRRSNGGLGARKGKEGVGCKMECCGDKLFCSRGGEVEMWSEVMVRNGGGEERVVRSNVLGRTDDGCGPRITALGFAGSRMAVVREGEVSVEVWESSTSTN